MFIAQHGVLLGFAADGRERFAANLSTPRNFLVRSIAQLPGDRLALFGTEDGHVEIRPIIELL
jgi:hypothetical protein